MTPPLIAVLPLGAHEQHGPHLPPETDSIIAAGVIDATKKFVTDFAIDFLPVEAVGYSVEHMWSKESRSLSYDEAITRWVAIGEQCVLRGIKKLVIFNAHGGNSPLMSIVATELRAKFKMLCVTTSWLRFGIPEGLLTEVEQKLDIHAGFIETSVMLVLAPQKVNLSKAKTFTNRQQEFAENFVFLRAYGPHSFGWMMNDLNDEGAAGLASRASAQSGRQIIEYAARNFATLLADVAKFDVNLFS